MYCVGDLVLSQKGRDCGKLFVVLELIDNEYVYIANGKLRKLENPKKKKIKHLKGVNRKIEISDLTNASLRKMLQDETKA